MRVYQRLKQPALHLLLCSFFFPCLLLAQKYSVPKEEFGYPDFNGVWNFNDSTPFERPPSSGEREFLNAEELAAKIARLGSGQERRELREEAFSQRILEESTDDTGAYNNFWSFYEESFPNQRTSIIVYPKDGCLPVTQSGVITQQSSPPSNPCNDGLVVIVDRPSRISFGAISCDRPEDFGLASRCLLFPQSTGPYVKANSYNNNVLIVVTGDHVVLNTELGNDPRIVPLDNRPFLGKRTETWTGSPHGFWEGDTLVIETRHFNVRMASVFMRAAAYGSAENMALTERLPSWRTRDGIRLHS